MTQAGAAFGPTANLSVNSSDARYREAPLNDLRRLRADQYSLQVTQPILRNTLQPALRNAEELSKQAASALRQSRIDAAQRLLEACFEFFKSRDALRHLRAQQSAVVEQATLARRSYELGRAAITDAREAEARSGLVTAQIAAAEQELRLRRQVLAELTGVEVQGLADLGLEPAQLPPLDPASTLLLLADANSANATIRQAERALAAAEAEVERAWQGHAPTVDATYNYARNSDSGTVTSLFGRRGVTSTIGVTMNVPLFASGATQSRVREAMALRDKAAAEVEVARSNVTLGVRQQFSAALAAIAQARALQGAVGSLDLSLRANRRGYELGMKINADVLEAQARLFEAQRDLSRAVYDAWLGHVKLRALTGALGEGDFAHLDRLLVPVPPVDAERTRAGAQ